MHVNLVSWRLARQRAVAVRAIGAGLLALAVGAAAAAAAAPPADPALAQARRLLTSTILFDGHNDLAEAISGATAGSNDLSGIDLNVRTRFQTDIPRLRAGLLGAQFWSVYVPGLRNPKPALQQLEQIDLMCAYSRATRRPSSSRPQPPRCATHTATAASPRYSAPRADTCSRTRWPRCGSTTHSACAT